MVRGPDYAATTPLTMCIGHDVGMRERSVAVATLEQEIDVSLLEAGAGGRPLLLVHGLTGAKEDFADQIDDLAELGWWVVAPDLRGHGSSSHPADEADYDLDRFAADLQGLVDALDWDRFVLLGHSMGGMIAQVVALARPDDLVGLILMDTSHGPIPGIDPAMAALGIELVRAGGMEAVKEALDGLGDDAPLGTEAYERVCRERPGFVEFGDRKFLGSAPAMYSSMLGQLLDRKDLLDDLATLDVPTLVMVGEQDEPFLDASGRMAARMKDATLAKLADAGHSPQFENPDAWWTALTGFLARLA